QSLGRGPEEQQHQADTGDNDERVKDAAHVRERMDLAISNGGNGGQHHVEAVEPWPAFDEMKAATPMTINVSSARNRTFRLNRAFTAAILARCAEKRNKNARRVQEGRITNGRWESNRLRPSPRQAPCAVPGYDGARNRSR